MNAGRLLREGGYDIEALRARIGPVDPDRVNIWPASVLLRRLWRTGIKGVTIWKWILVDPELMRRGDRDRLACLVVHELVHLRQFAHSGYLRFMSRYLTEYWRGRIGGKTAREAYLDISAEREAREVTEAAVRVI
ncbi:MAG: hypothetical protein ACRDU9_01000 [Acidimicrobiia bacterium]